jgi:hypothetical protein
MNITKNCGCGNYSPKFIGLIKINWNSGLVSELFECTDCHKQGQKLEMLNLEAGLGGLFKHKYCIEIYNGSDLEVALDKLK